METNKKTTRILEDVKINVKLKLSALWVTLMFLFAYVDIMGTFKPGLIEEIITGEVAGFQITQGWLLGVVIMMSFPALMVFLSLALKPKANRWTNIIVAIFNKSQKGIKNSPRPVHRKHESISSLPKQVTNY